MYFLEKGYSHNLQHLASAVETTPASSDMQPHKEKVIDYLKAKGVGFPAGLRVKNYLKTHKVTDAELQDLIYGRKLTVD